MKKQTKKITLHRETLRALDALHFEAVVGGAVTQRPICEFSGRNTCTTCVLTCTTNRC